MEATDKNCPHCGYALAEGATVCPCGLSLDDIDVPAPGIVRDSLERKLTLKKADDGMLEEIDVEEIAPSREADEGRQRREERPRPPEPPASSHSPGSDGAKPALKSSPPRAVREPAGQPRKSMIMACPSCGARISKRAPKCPKCGQSPYRSCQICAALITVNSGACRECGDPDPFLAQSA